MAVPPGFGDFFMSAASKGDVTLLQSLSLQFDNGEGPGKVLYSGLKTPEGMTALHLAAGWGSPEACTFLIDILGFDINATCSRGETPLFSAIIQRNCPTAKILISSGAEVTKRSKLGDTPLHCAANSGSKEIAMLLVSKGASVNAISQRGTPLGFAARCGHPDVLKYLLEQKADPNPKDSSPLSSALYGEPYPNIECIELLLKAGADPNYHCYLKTPLRIAASKLNEDIIRCLLRVGADPNMPDLMGYRPLEHAALLFRHKVVEILFPVTSHIACYPDWSIRGVMKHVESKEAKTLFKSKQKEVALFTKTKGAEAFKQKNYLDAGNWFSEVIDCSF